MLPVHVPATAVVHPDRDGHPYMSLGLRLNQNVLQSLLRDLQENLLPAASGQFAACDMDIELMEAWLRLLRLSKSFKRYSGSCTSL
ncbi:AraC family transcriptional regulator N-terminal domain-containing protein [Paenibacillus rhizoplanae]